MCGSVLAGCFGARMTKAMTAVRGKQVSEQRSTPTGDSSKLFSRFDLLIAVLLTVILSSAVPRGQATGSPLLLRGHLSPPRAEHTTQPAKASQQHLFNDTLPAVALIAALVEPDSRALHSIHGRWAAARTNTRLTQLIAALSRALCTRLA